MGCLVGQGVGWLAPGRHVKHLSVLLVSLTTRPSVPAARQDPLLLHGVDVSASRFFARPAVLRAADFAERAHRWAEWANE